jgi:hypothetical protein
MPSGPAPLAKDEREMHQPLARACVIVLLSLAACSPSMSGGGSENPGTGGAGGSPLRDSGTTPNPQGGSGGPAGGSGAGGAGAGSGGSAVGGAGGSSTGGGGGGNATGGTGTGGSAGGGSEDAGAPPADASSTPDTAPADSGPAAMGDRVALMDQLTTLWVKERESITMEGEVKVFKGVFKAGEIGGPRGHTPRLRLEPGKEYLLEYSVRFDSGWDFSRGGKLPGLAGATAPTGCVSTSGDGFSARLMWRQQGRLIGYMYDIDKSEECGTPLSTNFNFKVNVWHKVKQRVKLNTGRNRDGEVQIWVDGMEQVNTKRPLMVEAANRRIDVVLFHSFFGGSTTDWAPSRDVTISFSEIYATLLAK